MTCMPVLTSLTHLFLQAYQLLCDNYQCTWVIPAIVVLGTSHTWHESAVSTQQGFVHRLSFSSQNLYLCFWQGLVILVQCDEVRAQIWSSRLWVGHKVAAIYRWHFQVHFFFIKLVVFWFKFQWNLLPMVHLTIVQHQFRKCVGAEQRTSQDHKDSNV